MKTTVNKQPRQKLSDFADQHGLEMIVNERPKKYSELPSFYANFARVEVKDGNFLRSTHGDGQTPEEAIEDYRRQISEQDLVFDAYRSTRRDIRAPILLSDGP